MAGFDEIRLPEHIEQGASGSTSFFTNIIPTRAGFEQRNAEWTQPLRTWNISYPLMNIKDSASRQSSVIEIYNFFIGRSGRARGFRFKDWLDFDVPRQVIGTSDGSTTEFQIFKTYTSGMQASRRIIKKPVLGTVRVWFNGVEIAEGTTGNTWDIDYTTGIVTVNSAAGSTGQNVEVQCEFDVPARFDTDDFTTRILHVAAEGAGEIPAIIIKELRLP